MKVKKIQNNTRGLAHEVKGYNKKCPTSQVLLITEENNRINTYPLLSWSKKHEA